MERKRKLITAIGVLSVITGLLFCYIAIQSFIGSNTVTQVYQNNIYNILQVFGVSDELFVKISSITYSISCFSFGIFYLIITRGLNILSWYTFRAKKLRGLLIINLLLSSNLILIIMITFALLMPMPELQLMQFDKLEESLKQKVMEMQNTESLPTQINELKRKSEQGEITKEQYEEELNKIFDNSLKK